MSTTDTTQRDPLIVHEFRDLDEFRDAFAGWDMQVIPLDPGPFHVRWTERSLDDIAVVGFKTLHRMRETYMLAPGATTVALSPTNGRDRFRVRGAEVPSSSLTMLHPGVEYEVMSPSGGETLDIHVPDALFETLGLGRWPGQVPANVRPAPIASDQLRQLLSELVAQRPHPRPGGPFARSGVLDALGLALDSTDPSPPPAASAWLTRLYRQAVELIEEAPDAPASVVELASRLGVTTRTLRYAFRYALDVSPYRFMLHRRLVLVRDALVDPEQRDKTILQVLLEHGAAHQGEFSGQYRRLFGETPLQTRHRDGAAHNGSRNSR